MCDLGWGGPLKTHYSPCFLCYFVCLFLFTPSLLPTPILHRRKNFVPGNGGGGSAGASYLPVFTVQRNQRRAPINLSSINF